MRILFIVPYPTGQAPSQRFRFEHYYKALTQRNIEFKVSSFLDMSTWNILYKPGNHLKKFWGILKGFARRKWDVLTCAKYDYVFIHREFSPIGPPLLEWLMAKVFRKKIIYDFDDAIWIPNFSEHNSLAYHLKVFSNTKKLCRWAYKVSCGNDYLCNFAKLYNKNVVYNPTVVDVDFHHNEIAEVHKDKFVIGWTGSHSTMWYLDEMIPVLAELENQYNFEFHLISDKKPEYPLKSLRFVPWRKETEIADLLQFSIGIMPMPNDQWAQGKCGFKALQYMSLGIPAVVSAIGVSSKIVDHGINGFLCNTADEWKKYLIQLMTDRNLLIQLSKAARPKIEKYYSVKSNEENFLKLFS